MKRIRNYSKLISHYADFPKKDVMYHDFTPLLMDVGAFRDCIKEIANHFRHMTITKIVAVESKGFIIGSALAYALSKPLVLIRKPGLIPGKTLRERFIKEYGEAEYQLKEGFLGKWDAVLIVYDIMAGSGATKAAINLVEKTGAKVAGCAYIIELEYLFGREVLKGYEMFSLIKIGVKEDKNSGKKDKEKHATARTGKNPAGFLSPCLRRFTSFNATARI